MLENAPINSHQLIDLLSAWFPQRDDAKWILGSVYRLEGSAYRKPGSFMLMSDSGIHLGLLSGGCLESDLMQKARAFAAKINSEQIGNSSDNPSPALSVRYDSTDEDDMLFQLGLGCGGVVDILLQPVHENNDYLQLDALLNHLKAGVHCTYSQQLFDLPDSRPSFDTQGFNLLETKPGFNENPREEGLSPFKAHAQLNSIQGSNGVIQRSYLPAPPHLAIFGGGEDAVPVARMSRQLGWQVSVIDARPANARAEHFGTDIQLLKIAPEDLHTSENKPGFDAAVVMNHSVNMDAESLSFLSNLRLGYCAMLGPKHRKADVLEKAGLKEDELSWDLHGPAGFDIGADQPESIALAILAQCHQALFKGL